MKRLRILYALLFAMGVIMPAAAQQAPYPQPAAQQPNQPTYNAPAQAFPQLPPSRACIAQDLPGVWKLLRVYEMPVGAETTAFFTNPVQYMLFDANSTYGKYNAGRVELLPNMIRGTITQHASGLQQYLVDASGFVFFYQDKTAVDTQACFIVVNPLGAFIAGQMLLMPPEGQIKGRLMKVYVRVNENPPQPVQQPVQQRGQQRYPGGR